MSFPSTYGTKNNSIYARLANFFRDASNPGPGKYFTFYDGTDEWNVISSAGSPEGVHAADIGSLATDTTNGDLYIKQTDTVATGWVRLSQDSDVYPSGVLIGNGTSTLLGMPQNMQAVNHGHVWNLGFYVNNAAQTIVLRGANGSDLSASNPGYVAMQSNTGIVTGQTVVYTLTANQTLTLSDMTDCLFGTADNVDWPYRMPMYIGIAQSSTNTAPTMFICRTPYKPIMNTEPYLFCPGTVGAGSTSSAFLASAVTLANYANTPCCILGSLQVTKANTDVWTAYELNNLEGVGRFNQGTWRVAYGHYGAAASNYFLPNTGTAPLFSTTDYRYRMYPDGHIDSYIYFNGDGGTDGVGAVNAQIVLPMAIAQTGEQNINLLGSGMCVSATGGTQAVSAYAANTPTLFFSLLEVTNNGVVLNGDFTNGARTIYLEHQMPALNYI